MAMLKGRAIGGPRDGVVLTAPESWDGTISLTDYATKFKGTMYNGRYIWSHKKMTWVWSTGAPPLQQW